nr:hypothetical protein [Tanacetum cinerariifolium]
MRTRSSSNLPGESPPNPSSSNLKRHNRRRSKQPFILEESPVDMMAGQRTMAELLRAPTEDQDSLNSATGGNLLERNTQDVLTIIENKSKVRNSLNKLIVSQVKSSDANSSSSSEIAKLPHAVNQQTSDVTTAMTAILKQFQATPPPASVKAVEEICVTCGAAVNYNQGNSSYRPLGVANQIRPPAPTQQNQVVPLSELEKIKRINEANMKAMQTQINNVKNELRNQMKNSIQASMSNQTNELKNMMASFFQMNIASTSGSGSLPRNTITNLKGELKAITTRSGIVFDGSSIPIPPPFMNPEEDERVEETLTDQDLAEDHLHPNIPYPSRMHKQKQQEKDEVQIHKFWQMFKQLHINITLVDALILILKYHKILKALLSNKGKLLEMANTPLNENCSAVILKKLPEKLGDPGKFLILCSFSELKYKALANLVKDDIFNPEGGNVLIEKVINLDSTKDLPPPHNVNPLSGSTTSSNHLLEEFADELAFVTFPPGNNDLPFDIGSDLKEIEYFLNNDPIKEMDYILENSIDEDNLADLNDNLTDTMPEMFTDEHAFDYSSPLLYDEYDNDLFEVESNTEYAYDDPFDSKREKIKESKLLIGELDLPRSSDFFLLLSMTGFSLRIFSRNSWILKTCAKGFVLQSSLPQL